MTTIGERVKWAREKRKLSCAALDEIADLSCGHSASIESGRRETPSAATISKLAKALDVDLAWLINGGKQPRMTA
jgi:transcriptional regulator with XRE-family HTH domain